MHHFNDLFLALYSLSASKVMDETTEKLNIFLCGFKRFTDYQFLTLLEYDRHVLGVLDTIEEAFEHPDHSHAMEEQRVAQ